MTTLGSNMCICLCVWVHIIGSRWACLLYRFMTPFVNHIWCLDHLDGLTHLSCISRLTKVGSQWPGCIHSYHRYIHASNYVPASTLNCPALLVLTSSPDSHTMPSPCLNRPMEPRGVRQERDGSLAILGEVMVVSHQHFPFA